MSLTRLPDNVSQVLRVLNSCFRHRHHLVFSWLLALLLIYGKRDNLKALARHGPNHLAYQHYQRFLCAAYRCTKTLLGWFVDQALQAFAPAQGELLYLVVVSTLKGKRDLKHPVAQNTRLRQHHMYVFGFRLVILMAHWGVDRISVDFALLRCRDDPTYQPKIPCFAPSWKPFSRPPGARGSLWRRMPPMPPGMT